MSYLNPVIQLVDRSSIRIYVIAAFKGALLRFLGGLGRRPNIAQRIWTILVAYRVCVQDEMGHLNGLQVN